MSKLSTPTVMPIISKNCNHILLKGINKGKLCIFSKIVGSEYCNRHKHKHIEVHNCPICMEDIGNKNSSTLECGHKFHLSCIFELYKQNSAFSNKCPMCRDEFTKKCNDPKIHIMFVRGGRFNIEPLEIENDEPELPLPHLNISELTIPQSPTTPTRRQLRRQTAIPLSFDFDVLTSEEWEDNEPINDVDVEV